MTVLVSVVIPTCRRPQMLQSCLQALTTQDLAPDCYEVIVVNDGPDEATRQVVEAEMKAAQERAGVRPGADGVCIHYLPTPSQGGPAAARNLGWRFASGEIIAFTDDDCLPSPGWLTAGLRLFVDGVAGVQGRLIVPLSSAPTDYELNVSGLETSDFVTANCFYRRYVLETMGGFDEDFKMAWLEDRDLWFRMLQRGARLERAEDAMVIHPVRPARFGVSLPQQRKSMYNALLYKKHPDMFVEMQPPPPWRYYAILNCLLGMFVGLLFRNLPVFAIWAALWGALTLSFCSLRLKRTSHAPLHVLEMLYTSILIPPLSVYWRLRGAVKYRIFFL